MDETVIGALEHRKDDTTSCWIGILAVYTYPGPSYLGQYNGIYVTAFTQLLLLSLIPGRFDGGYEEIAPATEALGSGSDVGRAKVPTLGVDTYLMESRREALT